MKNNKPSLSVFFHPHVFWSLKVSGVGRYMVELGEAFTKMGVELHCPIKNTPTELLKNASFFEDCSRETPILPAYIRAALFLAKKLKLKLKFTRIERYLEGKRALQQGKFHVIHPTHNNTSNSY